MALARGLAGVREDYALLQAFGACPAARSCRTLQKCDPQVASDLVAVYAFREG